MIESTVLVSTVSIDVDVISRGVARIKTAQQVKVPPPALDSNGGVVLYFDKLVENAGVQLSQVLDKDSVVRLSITAPNSTGFLYVDPLVEKNKDNPLAMLLMTGDDKWVGIRTSVANVDRTALPMSKLERQNRAHRTKIAQEIGGIAGRVLSFPAEAVVGSLANAAAGGVVGLVAGGAISFFLPFPFSAVALVAGPIVGATVRGVRTAVKETKEAATDISTAMKEIGERTRAVREIAQESEETPQVIMAFGDVTSNLCPAANLRGAFQVYRGDGEPILYVVGHESDAIIDLRSLDKIDESMGIFVSGKNPNILFFHMVAYLTGIPILLYNPETGESRLLRRVGKEITKLKGKNHAIPIEGVAACVASYQLKGPRDESPASQGESVS